MIERWISEAGEIRKTRKNIVSLCRDIFFNQGLSLLNVDIETLDLFEPKLYTSNLLDLPKNFIQQKQSNAIRHLNTLMLDAPVENLTKLFNLNDVDDTISIIRSPVAPQHVQSFGDLINVGRLIFQSQELKEYYSKITNKSAQGKVIMPYIDENLLKNEQKDRTGKCLHAIDLFYSLYYRKDFKHDNVDNINLYHSNKTYPELFNEYNTMLDTSGNPCGSHIFAAMICGCIPVCTNIMVDYNRSIMRNGETCFIVDSLEEAVDTLEMIESNPKLLNNMRINAREVMNMVNNKEKFLDSWSDQLNLSKGRS